MHNCTCTQDTAAVNRHRNAPKITPMVQYRHQNDSSVRKSFHLIVFSTPLCPVLSIEHNKENNNNYSVRILLRHFWLTDRWHGRVWFETTFLISRCCTANVFRIGCGNDEKRFWCAKVGTTVVLKRHPWMKKKYPLLFHCSGYLFIIFVWYLMRKKEIIQVWAKHVRIIYRRVCDSAMANEMEYFSNIYRHTSNYFMRVFFTAILFTYQIWAVALDDCQQKQ